MASEDKEARKEDCWERIEQQYDSMDVFIQKNNQSFNHIVGKWFYHKTTEPLVDIVESSKQGKFFLALAKTGQLDWLKNTVKKDQTEAIRLLNEVITEDPKNSAPLLYLGLIYKSRGQKDLADKYFFKANNATKFDSYTNDFTSALFRSVKTPADLMAVVSIWGQSPIAKYKDIENIIVENKFDNIGIQMVAKALKVENNYRDINWDLLEYAYGKSILDKLGKGSQYLKVKDLIKSKVDFSSNLTGFTEMQKTCDINSLNEDVKKIHKYFH